MLLLTIQHHIKVLVTQERLQRFQEMLQSTPLVVVGVVLITTHRQQVVVVEVVVLVQVAQRELRELLEKDLQVVMECQPHTHTREVEVVEQLL